MRNLAGQNIQQSPNPSVDFLYWNSDASDDSQDRIGQEKKRLGQNEYPWISDFIGQDFQLRKYPEGEEKDGCLNIVLTGGIEEDKRKIFMKNLNFSSRNVCKTTDFVTNIY